VRAGGRRFKAGAGGAGYGGATVPQCVIDTGANGYAALPFTGVPGAGDGVWGNKRRFAAARPRQIESKN